MTDREQPAPDRLTPIRRTTSRRAAIIAGGATVVGAGALMLAACSTGGGSGSAGGAGGAGGAVGGSGASGSGTISIPAGTAVIKLADIPVGGTAEATVDGHAVVLSQPTAGEVVCFSAICTHQGCTVNAAPKDFECPCHQSRFDSATGAVLGGPAPSPLPKIDVKVAGDSVVTA